MQLDFTPEEEAFRLEVREFIEAEYPQPLRDKMNAGAAPNKQDYVTWQQILHRKGWIAPRWPEQYGGTGWSPTQSYIFDEEISAAQTPRVMPFGLTMLGPVLLSFGSEDQKQQYLPAILDSTTWWCQGYSEPDAGSDLASLKTQAVDKGDHYLVNGSKIWTTYAHYADKMFCLVRTSSEGRKQQGISFVLLDMNDPGVEVAPIITNNGLHTVNQVFLKDVKVPKENLVGEEGAGWTIAKYLLGHERTVIAGVAASKQQMKRLKTIAEQETQQGQPLWQDNRFRDRVAEVSIDLLALEQTNMRVLSDESAGRGPGPEASLLKIRGTEIQQMITELLAEAVGYYGLPYHKEVLLSGWGETEPVGPDYAAPLLPHYFDWRKSSIYGGSNEIQKNIIAKAVLGL
ncbi:MAG: acyl-CoA dehydrogenase family protein [Immundisolibacteraceae bacterium]|nr:acyl-CoA dehydrogenase family protein [Immundisolibacteraceae bacterium]